MSRSERAGRRVGLIALFAATLALALPTVAQAHWWRPPPPKPQVKVMSYNIYLGSSLDAALTAQTPEEFLTAVATIYGTVQFTSFPQRSEAIANIIKAERPDIIGLQEVSNWISTGPGAPPSLDFLAILQADLAERGLDYRVASTSGNADVGPIPLGLCSGPFGSCLLTLQDRDVILVNKDNRHLRTYNPKDGNYTAQQTIPSPVGVLSFNRGWATIDAKLKGKSFHFANTHLEVEGFAAVQEAQGKEFLAGPGKGHKVISVGDFNSAADGSTTNTYRNLTRYYRDAWRVNGHKPGYTCCQNGTLTNPTSELASRIDLILTRGSLQAVRTKVVGDQPFQAVPPFWPSDHAGVVSTINLR